MTSFDTRLLGHHVRHRRKEADLTLAQLGELVGRPSSYLSQLENGRIEPKLGLVAELADHLGCSTADLLDPTPPTRRAELEIALDAAMDSPIRERLGLAPISASAKIPDDVIEHLVGLYAAIPDAEAAERRFQRAGDAARTANSELRAEMRERRNHFPEIEKIAAETLDAVGYPGAGPLSERLLTDVAAYYGFRIERVQGMPRSARTITDQRDRVIYIPQRDDLKVRAARSVVLHTLGHYALDHRETEDFEEYIRQRIESNYFAAAMLVPEDPALEFLTEARDRGDISIEDLKERFYVSYEMAAHRFTNLAAKLEVPVHFMRTTSDGVITKAYEDDGIPFPFDVDGGVEGERLGRNWGARRAWNSSDSFLLHYQHTLTDTGAYWCVTYIETANEVTPHAITLGTTEEYAHVFRGGDTLRRVDARTEANRPDPELIERWRDVAWPSASARSHVLSALPRQGREFSPYPGIDLIDVYRFLDRQR